jgi:hypothetical protein
MSSEPEVVKVQLPLIPRNAPALIYNRLRSHEQIRHLDRDEARAMGRDMKAFFRATFDEATGFTLIARVSDDHGF